MKNQLVPNLICLMDSAVEKLPKLASHHPPTVKVNIHLNMNHKIIILGIQYFSQKEVLKPNIQTNKKKG